MPSGATAGPDAPYTPGLLKVLRETDPGYVLVDGTLAECDRVGDGRADYSTKPKRHGVNVQVITDPAGRTPWLSPALPGRTHDLTAARTQLRLARPLAADLRRPWEKPAEPNRPGPGRPLGSKNRPPATRYDVGKTVRRPQTIVERDQVRP